MHGCSALVAALTDPEGVAYIAAPILKKVYKNRGVSRIRLLSTGYGLSLYTIPPRGYVGLQRQVHQRSGTTRAQNPRRRLSKPASRASGVSCALLNLNGILAP
jgi:hypothetical protein